MLEIRVGNVFSDISVRLPEDQYAILEREMSFRPQGFQFMPTYNRWIMKDGKRVRRMWDGWRKQIWKRRNGGYYFPTGLLSILKNFLDENNVQYNLVNCRVKPKPTLDLRINDCIENRDYQGEIVDKGVSVGRGVIQVATGGGKSIIAAELIQRLNVSPFLFFVTSIDLLDQAKDVLEEALNIGGKRLHVGQIGGGTIDIQDINVMTIQTAVRALGEKWDAKHKFDSDDTTDDTPIEKRRADIVKLLNTAKGAISDEIQHWKAETCQLVARSLKEVYYTFGMSATPYRDEGDDLMINACFGKDIANISASFLIKEGWLIKPSIKIVNVRNEKSQFRQWQQLYKDQVSENEEYNQLVSNITNGYIQHGRLVLVLVQQIKHGQRLAELIPGSVFLSGKSSRKKRKEHIDKLRNKKISCIISTVIFDEGIDVRPLDTIVLSGQGKSKVRAMQRIGRILRPCKETGKTKATAIDFRIHQKHLLDHSLEREKMYRTEPEFEIEEINP